MEAARRAKKTENKAADRRMLGITRVPVRRLRDRQISK